MVDYYRNQGKLACVHGEGGMDEVFSRILEAIAPGTDVG